MNNKTVLASTARTTSGTADIAFEGGLTVGVMLFLDISARSGTAPTLDVKVQVKDPVSGNFVDIPSAAFAQKNAVGTDTLVIHPRATAASNRVAAHPITSPFRVVYTIGGTTPSFTFTVSATELR